MSRESRHERVSAWFDGVVAAQHPEPAWQRLDSELVRRTPWFDVRTDSVIRPDGSPGEYHHIVVRGSVTVLALDDTDQVVITRQWVYTHEGTQWRLPGGGIDPGDADPLAAARRELTEETGLAAAHWESLGQVNGADSLTNHVDHVFLATDLASGQAELEPGEADLEICRLPFDQAVHLVTSGEVRHAGSAHALLVAALRRTGQPAARRTLRRLG